MSFLGSVANLNGTMVRPHDIRLERESSVSVVGDGQPAPTRVRATVERIVRLGFEVRVDLVNQANGERFAAQVTRAVSEALGLRPGETVHAIALPGPRRRCGSRGRRSLSDRAAVGPGVVALRDRPECERGHLRAHRVRHPGHAVPGAGLALPVRR